MIPFELGELSSVRNQQNEGTLTVAEFHSFSIQGYRKRAQSSPFQTPDTILLLHIVS